MFSDKCIDELGVNVFRDPRNHDRVTVMPTSSLYPNPISLAAYEIHDGWVTPDNPPPMQDETRDHSEPLPTDKPPNLHTASDTNALLRAAPDTPTG